MGSLTIAIQNAELVWALESVVLSQMADHTYRFGVVTRVDPGNNLAARSHPGQRKKPAKKEQRSIAPSPELLIVLLLVRKLGTKPRA
jgi:hypothetical protein